MKKKTTLHGVLVVDKPAGQTSHDVVARVRRILGIKQVGHSGTLDPFATGVLLILLGQATRLMEYTHALPKTYEAVIVLGASSDTLDSTGTITPDTTAKEPTQEEVAAAVVSFIGDITQTPPIHSAVKYKGKKLYELARSNQTQEAHAAAGERLRHVTIHSIDILEFTYPNLRLRIICSSGTYIRTLAADIGRALHGSGAYVLQLDRTGIGNHTKSEAINIEATAPETLVNAIKPLETLVQHIPSISLAEESVAQLKQGRALEKSLYKEQELPPNQPIALYSAKNHRLAGIVQIDPATALLLPKKMFSF